MKIWTTTVDSYAGLVTMVHATEEEAYESLRENYALDVESGNHEAIVADLDSQDLNYTIAKHDFPEVLVVSVGNPYDGLTLYGPFFDADDALQYAYGEQAADWHMPTVHEPERN